MMLKMKAVFGVAPSVTATATPKGPYTPHDNRLHKTFTFFNKKMKSHFNFQPRGCPDEPQGPKPDGRKKIPGG
jgi:hypothetical protein